MSTIHVLLGALGGGGVLSAFVALLKLRPDGNTAAVTQSQSAMESMAILVKQLEVDRDDSRARAQAAERHVEELEAKLDEMTADGGRRKNDP